MSALKTGVTERPHLPGDLRGGHAQPRASTGCSTPSSRTCPRRPRRARSRSTAPTLEPDESKDMVAFVFKTLADPFAGRLNLFRVYQGVLEHDSQVHNCRAHVKERIGQLLVPQGKDSEHADEFGPGDIGAVAKLKETRAGDVLSSKDTEIPLSMPEMPKPVMAFAIEAEGEGRRGEDGRGAPPPAGGGPDDRLPPRPADRRADRGRAHPDPRRGDRGPDERALRRRGGAAPAARALPRDDQGAAPRRTPATRSRPAAAASSPTATSRSSRSDTGRASTS